MSTNESERDEPLDHEQYKRKPFVGPLAFLWTIATSYGTSCVLLLLLMYLTYRGTVDQVSMGLIGAQDRYFDSLIWYRQLGPLNFPMPGAVLLQALLAVNLLCGGMLRLRMKSVDYFVLGLLSVAFTLMVTRRLPGNFWVHLSFVMVAGLACTVFVYRRKSTLGIMVIHIAMAGLLTAGLVKMQSANSGYMQLFEDPTGGANIGSTYTDFHLSELVFTHLLSDGSYDEIIVHDDAFKDIGPKGRATITLDQVPFTLLINQYMLNCDAKRSRDGHIALIPQPEGDAARNLCGVLVTAQIPGQPQQSASLWGVELAPWTLMVGKDTWTVGLRRRVRDLPWSLRLDKFTHEVHPGTGSPSVFKSDVTRLGDDGVPQKFAISMNAPLRYEGFTFSQNGWGPGSPEEASFDPRTYTKLEVSTNPSDQWPKYWCFVMAYGMFIHFLAKLTRFVVRAKKEAIQ